MATSQVSLFVFIADLWFLLEIAFVTMNKINYVGGITRECLSNNVLMFCQLERWKKF